MTGESGSPLRHLTSPDQNVADSHPHRIKTVRGIHHEIRALALFGIRQLPGQDGAELLAEVYIDLIGARQSQLILASETRDTRVAGHGEMPRRQREIPLAPRLTEADRAAHRDFVLTLGDKPIWNDFLPA